MRRTPFNEAKLDHPDIEEVEEFGLEMIKPQEAARIKGDKLKDIDDKFKEKFKGIELNEDLVKAFKAINSGDNLFITGDAGSGKSTLLHMIKELSKVRLVVTASTGISAVNVGGSTIHSFLKLGIKVKTPENVRVSTEMLDDPVYHALEMLVIDEVSMIRVDVMDIINVTLQKVRGNTKPFGGVQMIMIGDLNQLPPVVGGQDEKSFIASRYKSEFFFDSDVIRDNPLTKIVLKKVYRQKAGAFLDILNAIKKDQLTNRQLNDLNERIGRRNSDAIYLSATNRVAEDINAEKLDALPGEPKIFKAKVSGDADRILKKSLIPETLSVKIGAQVMFLVNSDNYRNGTLGTVVAIGKDDDGDFITVEVNGVMDVIKARKHTWDIEKPVFDKESGSIDSENAGKITGFALKLAWAVSIHKSQGQTYQKINVDMGKNGAFSHGQTYVALSRCTTLEGITLIRPIRHTDIIFNPRVLKYNEEV